jgi:hypothetical protein
VCFPVRPDCMVENLEAWLLCFRGHISECNDLKGVIEGLFAGVVNSISSPIFISRSRAIAVIKDFPGLLPIDAAELVILEGFY